MRKSKSQKAALCGVLAALSVVLLLAGSALQVGTYAAPMLAAFLLIPVQVEYGPRYALLLYLTTAVLALLLVPETELALFYALAVGHYPVLRCALRAVRPAVLRWVLTFLAFNAAVALLYALLAALLGPAVWRELTGDSLPMLLVLLGMGNAAFFLYDRALGVLTRYYRMALRPRLRRFW